MAYIKHILVLAKHDQAEAMRVAAGLAIYGLKVDLVFADYFVQDSKANRQQTEALELSEIEPLSLVDDPLLDHIETSAFIALLNRTITVLTL